MDRERALNLSAAAELAGMALRDLRRHIKDGHLPQTAGADGKPRVTIGDLADAGLIPHQLAGPVPGNGGGGLQTWTASSGDSNGLLQRLLVEREQAASASRAFASTWSSSSNFGTCRSAPCSLSVRSRFSSSRRSMRSRCSETSSR